METTRLYRQSDKPSRWPQLEYTRILYARSSGCAGIALKPCFLLPVSIQTLLWQGQDSGPILSLPAALLEARDVGIEFDKLLLEIFHIAHTLAGLRMFGGHSVGL
jgi:hypothetical protein